MIYWDQFKPNKHKTIKIIDKKNRYDDNIYTFDIETSSYLLCRGKIYPASEHERLMNNKEDVEYYSCMYIWMFGINETVYYGRTWEELRLFLSLLNSVDPAYQKIVYVHNLAFEFQFLFKHFPIDNVFARKSRKVISADLADEYDAFSFRCSLFLTNTKLANLPGIYNLPVKKLEGDLDYSLLRNSKTKLSKKELDYCENDCLVLFHTILFFKNQYKHVFLIPKTSTGIVRKEFKDRIAGNKTYINKVKKAYNSDPYIYTLLVKCFQGGYTHANVIYVGDVFNSIDSYDESSAYPYHMVSRKYPGTRFKKVNVKKREDLLDNYAYLLKVKFFDLNSKFYNHFISYSKCYDCLTPVLDNGRIVSCKECTMILTDVDFKLYLDCYDCSYEILESYSAIYKYLPIEFVKFILEKYEAKTKLKGVDLLAYALEKAKFNALFGMAVTNDIREEVYFHPDQEQIWIEEELTDSEIEAKLRKKFNYAFLEFSWGVWITSWSRDTLIRSIIKNDEYNIYSDTDSQKLLPGYNKQVFIDYNKSVLKTLQNICKIRKIHINKFRPADSKGKKHLLGVFEYEETYKKFKTLGAKKYCYVDENDHLHITVSGVPKSGAAAMKSIEDFKPSFVFRSEVTNKLTLYYNDNIPEHYLIDYQGNKDFIPAGSGVTMAANHYTLGMPIDFENLVQSSKRAFYHGKEEKKLLEHG